MKKNHGKFITCIAALASWTLNAQETRQHGSHAHGIGELNIVAEGEKLLIELISPSANFVGFEHLPESATELESVKHVEENLSRPESLFELSADAGCSVLNMNIESALINEMHEAEHAHDEHDESDAHSEFHVQYEFDCADMEKLTAIDVNLFDVFPLTESLNVQMLSTSGQTQKTLNSSDRLLDF